MSSFRIVLAILDGLTPSQTNCLRSSYLLIFLQGMRKMGQLDCNNSNSGKT